MKAFAFGMLSLLSVAGWIVVWDQRVRADDSLTCRLVSEERLSTNTRACRYHCAAGYDYVETVKGYCPRYVRVSTDE